MKDIWPLIISILALLFSIISLFLGRHWSDQARNETWKRDVRLPYYKKIKMFASKLYGDYVLGDLDVYRSPVRNFNEYINEANTLGLEEIVEYLSDLHSAISMAEGQNKHFGKVEPGIMRGIQSTIEGLMQHIQDDIRDLTMVKPSLFQKLRNILSRKSSL